MAKDLLKHLRYKQPYLINGAHYTQIDDDNYALDDLSFYGYDNSSGF